MKLLICTQAVDESDPSLGFFVAWIRELASRYERIEVIALSKGAYELPANVAVHSLGKEALPSRVQIVRRVIYAIRFMRLALKLRGRYDTVFVHQNQEYALIAGFLWRLMGKRMYLWRNHYNGSLLTDIAIALSIAVFCTSRYSYTARSAKCRLMPVGAEVERFALARTPRHPRSILYFARFAPSKKPHVLLEALGMLRAQGVVCTASFVGSALPKDEEYRDATMRRAHELDLLDSVTFREGVAHADAPPVFASHELFVNLSGSGMYDKTLFEAAACGCLILAESSDFAALSGAPAVSAQPDALAHALRELLDLPPDQKALRAEKLRIIADAHSLSALADRLVQEMR